MRRHFIAMRKAGLSLAFFALISVVLVAVTNNLTKDKIIENQAMMLLQALNEVIPAERYDNNLVKSKIILPPEKTGFAADTPVFLATLKGKPTTAIFEVTTFKGYSGAITILIGINADDHKVSGVRIVEHKETPGLGDKMETRKSDWVLAFNGKSLSNTDLHDWKVKKDGGKFDQFTGATITPRAIVNAVKSTLIFAQDNIEATFKAGGK